MRIKFQNEKFIKCVDSKSRSINKYFMGKKTTQQDESFSLKVY